MQDGETDFKIFLPEFEPRTSMRKPEPFGAQEKLGLFWLSLIAGLGVAAACAVASLICRDIFYALGDKGRPGQAGSPWSGVAFSLAALFFGLLCIALVPGAVAGFLFVFSKVWQSGKHKAEQRLGAYQSVCYANLADKERYENDCVERREWCLRFLKWASDLQMRLPKLLDRAAASVREARKEYDQSAFRVMFHRCESAYRDLKTFDRLIEEMRARIKEYQARLLPYRHTFPAVAPPPKELTIAAQTVVSTLACVTRLADTNPTCTAIGSKSKRWKFCGPDLPPSVQPSRR